MLVFIDEAGDSGMYGKSGSRKFFVISLVIFPDKDEAKRCDQTIQVLKENLFPGKPNPEFHCSQNKHNTRIAFLECVSQFHFMHFSLVLNKELLTSEGFKNKESMYKYACRLVFSNADAYLEDAVVVIDKNGSNEFETQLKKYLRNHFNKGETKMIKRCNMRDSSKDNLLQLADYVANITNRWAQKKKLSNEYMSYINRQKMRVQIWPKQKTR